MRRLGKNKRNKGDKHLQDALFFLTSACDLILGAKASCGELPDEEDMHSLHILYEKALHIQLVATYVESCLRRRKAGLPELPPPWECR